MNQSKLINNTIIILIFQCLFIVAFYGNSFATDSSFVRINNIKIEGNKRTKSFIIQRELDIKLGDSIPIDSLQKRLIANQQRIFNTTLFGSVEVNYNRLTDLDIDVLIIVKENWYVWAAPYARLNDRNFNEWVDRGSDFSRLNYGAFIDHENFLGRFQKLEFVFETGFTNRFTLRYNIPYIDKKGNHGLYTEFIYFNRTNLNYTTSNNQLDFSYKDFELEKHFEGKLKYRYRDGFYRFHYFELGYNTTSVSDTVLALNKYYLAKQANDQQYATLGYTFRYDRRDNVNFTLKGRALILDVRKLGLFTNDNFDSWQFKLAYADYYPIKNKWYFNYIIKASAFTNANVPYNLLRGIGYEENILRGYDLFVINGSAYASGRLNLKKEIFRKNYQLKFIKWRQFNFLPINLFINGFVDAGYVYNKYPERIDNSLSNSRLTSYGIGIELNSSYNSTIKFNLSRNTLNQTNFFINFQKDIWTRWY